MAEASAPPKNVLALAPSLRTPGFRLVDAGELQALLTSFFGSMTGLTATGNNEATALQLKVGVNEITTAAAGTGVVLPKALPGMRVLIVNSSAGGVIVYGYGLNPATSDQIMPSGSSTPAPTVTQATLVAADYVCVRLGVWRQMIGV